MNSEFRAKTFGFGASATFGRAAGQIRRFFDRGLASGEAHFARRCETFSARALGNLAVLFLRGWNAEIPPGGSGVEPLRGSKGAGKGLL